MLKHAITDGNRWLTDVIRFAVGTGLRRGDVCSLRWSTADLKGQMLTVKNTEDFETKSGHERPVPLLGDALTVLVQRHEERITMSFRG